MNFEFICIRASYVAEHVIKKTPPNWNLFYKLENQSMESHRISPR